MSVLRRDSVWPLLAAVVVAGCRGRSDAPPRVKTGAEEAAREYFEALVNRDWPAAYRALDPQSRAGCGRDQFARRAEAYRRALGFEPAEVHVQSCDERGDEAVAHVNLRGVAGSSPRVYRDAVGLRRGPAGWAVVLPSRFGTAGPPGRRAVRGPAQ
jgi:hypothetical protein